MICSSLFLVKSVTMERPCSTRHWFGQKCKYKIQSVKVHWKSPQKSNEILPTTQEWGQALIQNQLLINDTTPWGDNVRVMTDSTFYVDKYQTSHIYIGPFRTSDKIIYLDKFSVITNTLQVRMVCRDLTIFCRSGQIFKSTADKICIRSKLRKIYYINKTVMNLPMICRKRFH